MLRRQPGIAAVSEAEDGQVAVELALKGHAHVIVIDIDMPRLNGIKATRRIKAEMSDVRVIGLSTYEAADMAKMMQEAGADAYLHKGEPPEALIAAVLGHQPPA